MSGEFFLGFLRKSALHPVQSSQQIPPSSDTEKRIASTASCLGLWVVCLPLPACKLIQSPQDLHHLIVLLKLQNQTSCHSWKVPFKPTTPVLFVFLKLLLLQFPVEFHTVSKMRRTLLIVALLIPRECLLFHIQKASLHEKTLFAGFRNVWKR